MRASSASAPATPRHLRTTRVTTSSLALAWSPVHAGHENVSYQLFRDRHLLAEVRRGTTFTDRHVKSGHAYSYSVRARIGGRVGRASRPLVVQVPPRSSISSTAVMTEPMVDRLFWRAGFGPSGIDRERWTGQRAGVLVDHFLSAPYGLVATSTPPKYHGNSIDPLASDPELQLEWLDRMQRATNPFVERMNLFWHRHFAVSRDAGIPPGTLLTYRDRLRRYSDFAANPNASFHNLALEMTTQDAAMSQYLTGYLNRKGSPNENYAREFMELFTLGVTNAKGQPNYAQTDVHDLARSFTGYTLNQATATVTFNPARFDSSSKTILGRTGNFDAPAAVGIVLSHPSHGPFLVRKLWSEFIAAPIPAATQSELVSGYLSSGLKLAPLLRGILSHPLIFDSIGEPTMIKSPIVYVVGLMRTLGAPLVDTIQTTALGEMQQQPYHPPNVAGWEGGLSWMTSGTSSARFDVVARCISLLSPAEDVPGETPYAAYLRAFWAAGTPWLSSATTAALMRYSEQAPARTPAQRLQRHYALLAFMLGGPDGQVT